MTQLLVINGPNLNLLGTREPSIYGADTLEDIETRMRSVAEAFNYQIEFFQSNHEGVIIDLIHEAGKYQVDLIIINPAAFTHTSVAIRDAIKAVGIPCIEVHLSNIHTREVFRTHSYFSDIAIGTISGLGAIGYELAVIAAHNHLTHAQ
ncbi:type II 3-dehydroquinate dehydratase [Suttonella ornithocola]|uniref:3-dehydroquinate dehydratase n=1 Tax=Suttonella ornithocola TaxID=279832 RepID=A0A380MLP3_9GAMM|nr:type II 3-dehydroquinate dehydratase [Suttonella ornithocola]SUO93242.1 3-dehydroquinate dehydratase [Suttonella ornithocola]